MVEIGRRHPAARFLLVGCANFIVSSAVFYFTYRYSPFGQFGGQGAVANVLAYGAGMINSFVLNRTWTFRAKGEVVVHAARFIAINIATLALSSCAVFVLIDRLDYPALAVWLPLTVVILVLHYLGMKHWSFAERA